MENDSVSYTQLPVEDYYQLLKEVELKELFERTYWAYFFNFLIALLGMAGSLYVVSLTNSILVQVINALVFGFFSVQAGIIAHDLSHGQVFWSKTTNRYCAVIVWGLIGGLSESNWFHSHDMHHKSPNHIGHDPALLIPFVFCQEQVESRPPFFKKWILPYQEKLFWPMLCVSYPANVALHLRYLLQRISFRSLIEILFMVIHFSLLFWFVFHFLPFLVGCIFLGVYFLMVGAYMGVIFAPNHKGEAMLSEGEVFNWVYQIIFTRNLKPSRLTSYIFGGLDTQIEHHLFTTMSRYKHRHSQSVVKNFCMRHSIPFHEISWHAAFLHIHASLKRQAKWHSASVRGRG